MEQNAKSNQSLYAVSAIAVISLLITTANHFELIYPAASITTNNVEDKKQGDLVRAAPMPLEISNPSPIQPIAKKELEDDKNLQAISKIINNIQKDIVELKQDIEQVSTRVDGLKEQMDGKRKASVTVSSASPKTGEVTRKPAKNTNPNEFTILGANAEQLIISQAGETKKIASGGSLPNGAIFQGFDGKQIQTNLGVYLVD